MTPSAESLPEMEIAPSAARKNVTFAVNYETTMMDERWSIASLVESVPKSTKTVSIPTLNSGNTKCEASTTGKSVDIPSPFVPQKVEMREISSSTNNCPSSPNGTGKATRRSNRESKKRGIQVERHRVRYDMELVPPARRNRVFLESFPSWWSLQTTAMQNENEETQKLRRSSRLCKVGEEQDGSVLRSIDNAKICTCANSLAGCNLPSPFEENSSVVWIPANRSEWEDCVSEMTAVCTSASHRRHEAFNSQQPFVAPLSREYIRDRVDIDDPLNGYQIRHKTGGWMQGFILWTNFTTWTQYFKFDSLHPRSGITLPTLEKVDADGSLSAELEAQPRSGDPYIGGIVFDSIAEIGLLGGIGCGEYLLRMALDDIRLHHNDKYKYVVLQATEESKTFYERFGFSRVGAVCTYKTGEQESEIVGYRHWTNANESERSLLMHGGPSYLMALKLPANEGTAVCTNCDGQRQTTNGDPLKPPSFLQEMKAWCVDTKPKIEQLGAASTPAPKSTRRKAMAVNKKRGSDAIISPTDCFTPARTVHMADSISSNSVQTMRLGSSACAPTPGAALPDALTASGSVTQPLSVTAVVTAEQRSGNGDEQQLFTPPVTGQAGVLHRDKRQKKSLVSEDSITPSSKAESLTWAEKQYQSIWLAVPPKPDATYCSRKPPRERSLSKPALDPKSGTENFNRNSTPDLITPPVQFAHNANAEFAVPATNLSRNAPFSTVSKFTSRGSLVSSTRNLRITTTKSHEKLDTRLSSCRALQPLSTDSGKTNTAKPQKVTTRTKKRSSVVKRPEIVDTWPDQFDRATLNKQKMKSYPRDRVHFYNKVVRPKSSTSSSSQYYFVLHYDEDEGWIRIVPLKVSGVLTGSRAGRPRWKAVLEETHHNIQKVSTANYVPVEAKMVMKTPLVAVEAWDILDAK